MEEQLSKKKKDILIRKGVKLYLQKTWFYIQKTLKNFHKTIRANKQIQQISDTRLSTK